MFTKLLAGRRPAKEPFPSPCPEQPVEIVGDLHGCRALLERLPDPQTGVQRVYVGDLVDRGPDSRGVIAQLRAQDARGHTTVLLGNHEAMLLSFLDDPTGRGTRWLRYGGLATMLSYGLDVSEEMLKTADLMALSAQFREALGPDDEAWLRARPKIWQSGNLAVAHAGADPARAITDQPDRALVWGHRDFDTTPRDDGIWIAHGHTIVKHAVADAGRISVDTGAFRTGRLTLARVNPEGATQFETITHD